jgi:hypothetical protein
VFECDARLVVVEVVEHNVGTVSQARLIQCRTGVWRTLAILDVQPILNDRRKAS